MSETITFDKEELKEFLGSLFRQHVVDIDVNTEGVVTIEMRTDKNALIHRIAKLKGEIRKL